MLGVTTAALRWAPTTILEAWDARICVLPCDRQWCVTMLTQLAPSRSDSVGLRRSRSPRAKRRSADGGKLFVFSSEFRIDGILSRRLDEILPRGAVGAVRRIGLQDDQLLSPAESACIGRAVVARRRASGAARMLARSLLSSISKPLLISLGRRATRRSGRPKSSDRLLMMS